MVAFEAIFLLCLPGSVMYAQTVHRVSILIGQTGLDEC
jgi:hypothetical protein